MKAFNILAAVVLAVVATAEAKSFSTQEKHPIDWYDCSGKDDKNYDHPTDCTRFISCSGNIASERDCAACHVDAVRCPEGRLVYNSSVDACLWADETTCGGGGGGPSTGNPEPEPSTTQRSTTTDAPVTSTPSQRPTTTDAPVTSTPSQRPTTTEEPGNSNSTIPEDRKCNPLDCRTEGYCQSYKRCDNETKLWVDEECGGDLVWNPKNKDGTPHIHGGNCGTWENLDEETTATYRNDPFCLRCFWNTTAECSGNYLYQAPNQTRRNVLELSCEDGLIFSLPKETCLNCANVTRASGNTCCEAD